MADPMLDDLRASIKDKNSTWMVPIRVSDLRWLLGEVERLRAAERARRRT